MEPVRIDDFKPLAPLVKGYELQPDKHYLIVVDGKKFDHELAYKLLASLREDHPELTIHIIATVAPEKISVMEKKENEPANT